MPDHVFGDDRLRATLSQTDDALTFVLEDRVAGRQWGPVPLLDVDVYDKTVRRVEPGAKLRVDRVATVDDGLHLALTVVNRDVELGLALRIRDGELRVKLQPTEVYERRPAHFRLFAVDVLPGLLQVSGAGAELLSPINSGMITRPAGKPKLADRFLCYMEQERWEMVSLVPVCGAMDGKSGMAVVAVQGDCDAQCRIATDGEGGGSVGFAMSLRRHWPDPVDRAIREYVYAPIAPGDDLARAAGKRLRRHIVEDHGKPTLTERAAACPEVRYMLDAYTMKLFHAIEQHGLMMVGRDQQGATSYLDVMTFAEAREKLSMLHAKGIDKIYTQSVGWNARGHDGLYPQRFPVDERLGGEAGFRALIEHAKSLGYMPNVHDNFLMNSPDAENWDADVLIQDIHGEPLIHGWWAAGLEYASWPLALPESRLGGHMQRMKDLGLAGPYYLDYMYQPLEVNYHPKHQGPRSQHAAGMTMICERGRDYFGSVATELGTMQASLVCDMVVTVGAAWHLKGFHEHWPVRQLLDDWAPVWHYAFSGLTAVESHGTDWTSTMRAVLWGHHPRDEWSARPGVFPPCDESHAERLKAIYDLAIKKYGYLQEQELIQWSKLSADVECTKFSDGTEVQADFAANTLHVNGELIEIPKSFVVK